MSVKFLEICQVAPPPEISSPISIPLTFVDLFFLKGPSVQLIFFYQSPNPESLIFSHLKSSLSKTLQHFPVLAGHVTWPHASPGPVVHYESGDSLSLTLARSHSDFCHLSSNGVRGADDYHDLLPVLDPGPEIPVQDTEPGSRIPNLDPEAESRILVLDHEPGSRIPVLAVQVTVFEEGGFCIGLTTNHAFLDGKSYTAFLKAWASVSRFGENQEPTPVFDRNLGRSDLDKLYATRWLKYDAGIRHNLSPWKISLTPGKLRGTFEFNGLKIKRLKEYVKSKGISGVSSFSVAYAYVLTCLVKAKKVETRRVLAIILTDYRAHSDPPLPMTYIGNCVIPYGTVLELGDLLGDNGFVFATREINETLHRCSTSVGLEGIEDWYAVMFNKGKGHQEDTVISIAGSNRFGFYGLDFGWGSAVRAETSSIDGTGAISFSDERDGLGVEIGLVLSKDEMATFVSLFEQGFNDI